MLRVFLEIIYRILLTNSIRNRLFVWDQICQIVHLKSVRRSRSVTRTICGTLQGKTTILYINVIGSDTKQRTNEASRICTGLERFRWQWNLIKGVITFTTNQYRNASMWRWCIVKFEKTSGVQLTQVHQDKPIQLRSRNICRYLSIFIAENRWATLTMTTRRLTMRIDSVTGVHIWRYVRTKRETERDPLL